MAPRCARTTSSGSRSCNGPITRFITAEELGVTQANVDEKLKSDNPAIRRLLGVEGSYGEGLGLTNDWAYRIIKAVGNYGEIFERNVGQGSPIKIAGA